MNTYFLYFDDTEMEREYQQRRYHNQLPILIKNLHVVSIIFLVTAIYYAAFGAYSYGAYAAFIFLLQQLCARVSGYSSKLMDCMILLIQVCCSAFMPLAIKLHINDADQNTYIVGQTFGFLQFSLLIASRYCILSITLILNMFITFGIIISQQKNITMAPFAYLCFGSLILHTLYVNESNSRKLFLKEKENQNWESVMETALKISILQCSCDSNQKKIIFGKSNVQAQRQTFIKQQSEFTNFIRQTTLTTGDCFNLRNKRRTISTEKLKSTIFFKEGTKLENFLYCMFTSPGKCFEIANDQINKDQVSIYGTHFYLQGKWLNVDYKITLFLYLDSVPRVIIMLERDQRIERRILREKLDSNYRMFLKSQEINQKLIIPALVKIERLYNITYNYSKTQTGSQIKRIYNSLQSIRQDIYLAVNDQYNLEIFNTQIECKSMLPQIDSINLIVLLRQISCILYPLIKSKKLKLTVLDKTPNNNLIIRSNLKYVKQMFLNLIHNSIVYSHIGGTILIEIESFYDRLLEREIYSISIKDQDEMNVQNLKEQNSMSTISKNQSNLQLGLIISNLLLFKLGPTNIITIKKEEASQSLKFELYCNLDGINLHPYLNYDRQTQHKCHNINSDIDDLSQQII